VSAGAHFATLLAAIIASVGIIGAGLWRIAAAVFKLASTVTVLAWRVEQIERRQLGLPAEPAEHRRRRGATGG
jgi:hypothetical protein